MVTVEALNVFPGRFSWPNGLRMGDMIALCNLLEYVRIVIKNPTMKAYIPEECVYSNTHCLQFRNWLAAYTDYIVSEPPDKLFNLGFPMHTDPTYENLINLWNIRKDVREKRQTVVEVPDLVKIKHTYPPKNKVVICPLMDADYNFDRNWSLLQLEEIMVRLGNLYENNTAFLILSKDKIDGINIHDYGFTYSHKFSDNLRHVMECKHFVGGDSGFSHFASALDPTPNILEYHYPNTTYGTTFPFHWTTKGNLVIYDV